MCRGYAGLGHVLVDRWHGRRVYTALRRQLSGLVHARQSYMTVSKVRDLMQPLGYDADMGTMLTWSCGNCVCHSSRGCLVNACPQIAFGAYPPMRRRHWKCFDPSGQQ